LGFCLDFFNHRLNYLLCDNRLVDDNWLLHNRLLDNFRFFGNLHGNRFRNKWKHWLDKLRLNNLGLGLDLTDFDVELEFAVGRESNCVGHLQIRIVFDFDAFVVGVEVNDGEVADLGNVELVDELATLVVEVLVRLDRRDSFEGRFVVDVEGQLDVKVDDLGLVHFWLNRTRQ
jgi:hypothetical protein